MDPPAAAEGRAAGGTEQSWYKAAPGGTGITVLALSLSHPVDLSLLRTALHKIQTCHPIIRAKLPRAAGGGGGGRPFYTISPSPYLEIVTHDTSVTSEIISGRGGESSAVSPFHLLVEHELNQNPWAAQAAADASASEEEEAAPVFFASVYAVPGSTGHSVVTLRLHTSVCDRTSGSSLLQELLGLLLETGDGGGGGGRREMMPGIEELLPKEQASKWFWARGRDIVGYSLNFKRSACLPFQDAAGPRSSEMVRLVLPKEETHKLLSACKSRGVKLCAALAAAALIAAVSSKHLRGDRSETYTVVTLVDCRKYLTPRLDDHDLGFYHSAIQNVHTVHGGEDLWELSRRCHDSLSYALSNNKHLTDVGDLNFLMCKAIDNPHLTPSSSMRTALVSVFEEPVDYKPCEFYRRAGVEDHIGCASVHGVGPSIAVFDTICDGRLDCACIYPTPLHSRKQMEELVEHMKRVLVGGSDTEAEEGQV